jgi:hypothetical protein
VVSSVLDRKTQKLFWAVPVVLLSAWLETKLNVGFSEHLELSGAEYKHLALDVVAFFVIASVFVLIRRKAASSTKRDSSPNVTSSNRDKTVRIDGISNPELSQIMGNFLAAVDRADIGSLSTIYDANFTCTRVADDGGFVKLTREQMLSFLEQAVRAASNPSTKTGHAAVQTRETKIHHAELTDDMAYVLMTRVKDLGNGWEPMFYNLVWKKQDGDWRLLREFVHQKSSPQWS